MFFTSIAHAAEPGAAAASPLVSFMPLILIVLVFYFLIIRPNSKKNKAQREMLGALKAGDEILTISGIHGKIITVLDDGNLIVEIAPKVNVKLARKGISGKVTAPAPAKEGTPKKKSSKKKEGSTKENHNSSSDESSPEGDSK